MPATIDRFVRAPSGVEPTDSSVAQRLNAAKRAYTARHFTQFDGVQLLDDKRLAPRAGDLVLARIDRLGKHAQLEQACGRKSALFVGDEIVVAYAARYAPDQFEAHVPADLSPCHLVAGGGVAARVITKHVGIATATEVSPIGLLAGPGGARLNLAQHALPVKTPHRRPVTFASVGTSMNAGKTTSAAHLIRGLTRAGYQVGAAKLTGTGSGNDPWLLRDAGARVVVDFTDAGYASTHQLTLTELHAVMRCLLNHLAAQEVDVIVVEVADGLFQCETSELLRSAPFKSAIDAVVFSSGDAMGAAAGARWLAEQDLPLLALAGVLTKSPLARREALAATRLPVLGLEELGDAQVARQLVQAATPALAAA